MVACWLGDSNILPTIVRTLAVMVPDIVSWHRAADMKHREPVEKIGLTLKIYFSRSILVIAARDISDPDAVRSSDSPKEQAGGWLVA